MPARVSLAMMMSVWCLGGEPVSATKAIVGKLAFGRKSLRGAKVKINNKVYGNGILDPPRRAKKGRSHENSEV